MNISNYHLGDIYKESVLLKEWDAPTNDVKNSYGTTTSMSGPGNGPTTGATNTSPNNFDTQVMFPKGTEISNMDKRNMLLRFLKDEIDNGSFGPKTKQKFEELYGYLLGLKPAETPAIKKKPKNNSKK